MFMEYLDIEQATSKTVPYLPPCRICNSPASGFHYGVNTCEACKGFFRRTIARKTSYPPCQEGNCAILLEKRNSCAICRYQKCLVVGMSKSAIKTGRYTHAKRTRDTIEIKRSISVPDTSPADKQLSAEEAVNDEGPVILEPQPSQQTETTHSTTNKPVDSLTLSSDDSSVDQTLQVVVDAFSNSFRDTAFMFKNPAAVEALIAKVMKERNLDDITEVVVQNGATSSPEQRDLFNNLLMQAQTVRSIMVMNNSIPEDQLWEFDEFKNAIKRLFEIWSATVEKFVKEFIRFARQLPGFQLLPTADQIILIKAARSDVTALVKYKHVMWSPDVHVDYRTDSGALCVTPLQIIIRSFHKFRGSQDEYRSQLERLLKNLRSLDPSLEHLAVMCAIVVFSSDHEGLSKEGQLLIGQLQEKLIPVLTHCLEKTHPKGKLVLSKFLMLLPALREFSVHNAKYVQSALEHLNPDLSALLFEVLPVTPFSDSTTLTSIPGYHNL